MKSLSAAAVAHPNIAFIKYWGNRSNPLRLPANGSISMNLAGLTTTTRVAFSPELTADTLILNGQTTSEPTRERVCRFLDHVRALAGSSLFAEVVSDNNFPTGAGIASSASAFAALSLAASQALGLHLEEAALSRLARLGSGSACRSIPTGFVEWQPGCSDADSYAFSLAEQDHWPLVDCIAVVATGHKSVGSTQGHATANTSPLQIARVTDAPRRLDLCRNAILQRDFDALAAIVELDSTLMHAVMMTSQPQLFYWEPVSLVILKLVPLWRAAGLPVCATLDAGPNVHVLTTPDTVEQLCGRLRSLPGVQQVITAPVGGPATVQKLS